ncbi:Arginine/ornithine antiporter ArcD [hydrothermal vent metagenome]|uniref:Arginine/ornithine antiporter ArcD n=1 Tax=hydrothermal vent metagenome TaxID=652676 RepID=A0A1W1CKX5_9ZZZZ
MALSRYDFKKFGFYNALASPFFVLVIMLSAYSSGDTIKALFESFKEYPWVPFVVLAFIIATLWYGMGYLTKRR